jgi:hypothetical protein
MPFKSEKQRRYMWAKHPSIAKKWAHGKHSSKKGRSKAKGRGR